MAKIAPLCIINGATKNCNYCYASTIIKNGFTLNGSQRYKCKVCQRRFIRSYKHHYAYDLPIAGLGSLAATATKNRQRYQGNEYLEELGLEWMDFHNRQYDPQLGRFLSVDPLADAGGQQVLSPYHAMGCNPVSMVDPFGLQAFGPANPMTVQDPAAMARAIAPTLLNHMPGGGLWDMSNMTRYISSLPKDLQAEAWMLYLSGGATGASTFQSRLGDLLTERAAQGEKRKDNSASGDFIQFVYEIENGYEISFDRDVLNTQVVHGFNLKNSIFERWKKWLGLQASDDTDLWLNYTTTNKVGRETKTGDFLGNELVTTLYSGHVVGNSGTVLTIDKSTMNGKGDGASISLFSVVTIGSNGKDVSVGVGAFGVEIHGAIGIGNGFGSVGVGGSYTNSNNMVRGGDAAINIGAGSWMLITAIRFIPILAL